MMRSPSLRFLLRILGVFLLSALFQISVAFASPAASPALTFNVNHSTDTDDGSCDTLGSGSGNQDCTLREAITAANANSGADTITFSISGTILLGSTLTTIADDMTLDGSGQSVTVSGNNSVQMLMVDSGTTLNLNALAIANG